MSKTKTVRRFDVGFLSCAGFFLFLGGYCFARWMLDGEDSLGLVGSLVIVLVDVYFAVRCDDCD